MDPRRLRLSLVALQLVAAATLLRSIAFERWITVLASVLLLVGATAAQRGKTWGVALAFGAAVAFPVAWLIGIAPAWFCLVGVFGSLPFALTSRAFARFDRGAATLLALLAASAGALGAVAWKQLAWSVFEMFPSLAPSIHAQHGLALTVVAASAVAAARIGKGTAPASETQVRVAHGVRVAEGPRGELDVTESEAGETRESEEQAEALRERGSARQHAR